MFLRTLDDVRPKPDTVEDILRHGLEELATLTTGGHADPTNGGYAEKVEIKQYAQSILAAADELPIET